MHKTTIDDARSTIAVPLDDESIVRISVVIPYFQRKTGILARALQSIKDQRFTRNVAVAVLVVDDCSPLNPAGECAAAGFDDHMRVRIIERPNGGPGAARNTGLDAVDPSTDFVAFLDSDDIWQPDHLQQAIDAMGQECDFYFCDHKPSGNGMSYFNLLREEQARYRLSHALVPTPDVTKADETPRIYLNGKAATLALVRRYLAHTSTIVFRRKQMAGVRFFEKLRFAGEDYLFSLELAHGARRTCCSLAPNVHRGNGIDLYMGSVAWSHPDNPKLVLDNLKCFIRARSLFGSDIDISNAVDRRIKIYRTEFVWVTLRRLLLFRQIDFGTVKSAHNADSNLLSLAPKLMIKATGAKLTGRRFIDLH